MSEQSEIRDSSEKTSTFNINGYIALAKEVYKFYSDEEILRQIEQGRRIIKKGAAKRGSKFIFKLSPEEELKKLVNKNPEGASKRRMCLDKLERIKTSPRDKQLDFVHLINMIIYSTTFTYQEGKVVRLRFNLDDASSDKDTLAFTEVGKKLGDKTYQRAQNLYKKAIGTLGWAHKDLIVKFLQDSAS